MPFSEIVKSVRSELYNRAVSPLMGSFILSWCAINFKFILLVFADLDITQKYWIIDDVLYSELFEVSSNNPTLMLFIYPSIMSLIYIFLYPKAAIPIFEYSRKRQKEMNDIRKKIDGETLLSREESRKIHGEIYRLEEEHQKEIARKDWEIEKLKNEVKNTPLSLTISTSESNADMKPKKKEKQTPKEEDLSQKEVELLRRVGHGRQTEYAVIDSYKDKINAKHIINQLSDKGYLEYKNNILANTKKGIAYLANNKDDS